MATEFADVIGPGTLVKGRIEGSAPLLVRGRVEGTISLTDHLVVSAEGQVVAEIDANVVTIEGRAEGRIVARERAILRQGAHVTADIKTPALTIEDGAHMVGRIDMDVTLPPGVTVPERRG